MIPDDAKLVQIAALIAAAQTSITKAAVLFAEHMDEACSPMSRKAQMSVPNIRSLQLWAEHLAANGPSLRQDIWDATGLNLSQPGNAQVKPWKGPMTFWPEESIRPDTVLKIQSLGDGKGRPKTVYFLWSQRFDVLPKFSVGPTRPSNPDALLGVIQPDPTCGLGQQYAEAMAVETELTEEDQAVIADLLGWDDPPEHVEEDTPVQTMASWAMEHDTILSLVAQGVKPTAEQFQLLRSTCPDGSDGANIAVAMAAKGR